MGTTIRLDALRSHPVTREKGEACSKCCEDAQIKWQQLIRKIEPFASRHNQLQSVEYFFGFVLDRVFFFYLDEAALRVYASAYDPWKSRSWSLSITTCSISMTFTTIR